MPTTIGRPGGHARARARQLRTAVDRLRPALERAEANGRTPAATVGPASSAPRTATVKTASAVSTGVGTGAAGRRGAAGADRAAEPHLLVPRSSPTVERAIDLRLAGMTPSATTAPPRGLATALTVLTVIVLFPVLRSLARGHAAGTLGLTAFLPGHGAAVDRASLWGVGVALSLGLFLMIPLDALYTSLLARRERRSTRQERDDAAVSLDLAMIDHELAWAARTAADRNGTAPPASPAAQADPKPVLQVAAPTPAPSAAADLTSDAALLARAEAEIADATALADRQEEVATELADVDAWYVLHDATVDGAPVDHLVLGPAAAIVLSAHDDDLARAGERAAGLRDALDEVLGVRPALLVATTGPVDVDVSSVGLEDDAQLVADDDLVARIRALPAIFVERAAASRRLVDLTGGSSSDPTSDALLRDLRDLQRTLNRR